MEIIHYDELPLRYILCIDVKSFFASVEAVRRGIHPLEAFVVVISDFQRPGAVVLASSPKVKEIFGIKTGNRKFEIPKDDRLLLVEPSMSLYLEYNRRIHDIFSCYAAPEDILTYSIDEAFLDVTSVRHLLGNPWEIAEKIKKQVFRELGLVVSIGIGDNPLLSKLALDNRAKKKRSQIAYWSYESIPQTVWKIPKLTDFWGIGRGYETKFRRLGIHSVYALAHFPKEILQERFGILGLQHYYHANGVDYTRLSQRIQPKQQSYSKGQVLMRDYEEQQEILIILMEMVEEVAERLRRHHKACEEIHLQMRLSKWEDDREIAKSRKIPLTHSTKELKRHFRNLFLQEWKGEAIRQIMVFCNQISSSDIKQLDIFSLMGENREERIDEVLDRLKEQFGKTSVFRGYQLLESSTFFARAKKVGGHKGHTEVGHETDSVERTERL